MAEISAEQYWLSAGSRDPGSGQVRCSSHGIAAPGGLLCCVLGPPLMPQVVCFDRTGLAMSFSAALRRIGRRVQIWDNDLGR